MDTQEQTTAEMNRKQLEREENRGLLVIYDVLIFLLTGFALLVIRPSDYNRTKLTFSVLLVQALVPMVCIFGFRFLFRVYKQVLRYGNMRAWQDSLQPMCWAVSYTFCCRAVFRDLTGYQCCSRAAW